MGGAADGDAAKFFDARLLEVAHQHAPRLQPFVHGAAGDRPVPRKHKVRLGRQHKKTAFCKFPRQPFALGDDERVLLLIIGAVGNGGGAHRLADAVDGVRIEAVAAAFQPVDEGGAAHGVAAAHARQRISLGKGLDHEQVLVAVHEGHGAFIIKRHVRFVYDDGAVGVAAHEDLDLCPRDADARGGVWVGDQKPLRACFAELSKILREVFF